MSQKGHGYLTAQEFISLLDGLISKNTFYKGIKEGQIPHIRIGKKIFVRKDALSNMEVTRGDDSNE